MLESDAFIVPLELSRMKLFRTKTDMASRSTVMIAGGSLVLPLLLGNG